MRTLSQTLLAAQKAASGTPYVRAVFSDYAGDRSRVRLTRHYSGSEGEYFCAVVGAGDGSLIRARIDPSTKVLYTSRVTSPGPGSTFSSWTSHGTVSASAAVALAWRPVLDQVVLFYVAADGVTLTYKVSSDNGASWSGANVLEVAAAAVGFVALAYNLSGSGAWLWTVGATVRVFVGAGPSTAWSNSVASVTGIACRHFLDFDVVVCGAETVTDDAKVWTAIYGDGAEQAANTWSGLSEVATASAGSNVSFRSPALELLQHWRLFFVEKYAGTQAYSRLQWSIMNAAATFSNEQWSEPAAFAYEGDYGVAASAANLDGYLWLVSAAGVWSGRSPTQDDLDVSEDVIEVSVQIDEDGGLARLVLRNDPGKSAGLAATAAVHPAPAERELQPPPATHRQVRRRRSPGLLGGVHRADDGRGGASHRPARDAWSPLERWRLNVSSIGRSGRWPSPQLLQFVARGPRPTFESQRHNHEPCPPSPSIPGERTAAATPAGDGARPGFRPRRRPPCASPGSRRTDYAYVAPGLSQTAEHAILSARCHDLGPATNRVRVVGAGAFTKADSLTSSPSANTICWSTTST
jgi:hypothetical protein